MLKIFIFIPIDIENETKLNGFVQKTLGEVTFYIIRNYGKKTKNASIGYCGNSNQESNSSSADYIQFHQDLNSNEIELSLLKVNNVDNILDNTENQIFFIKYDRVLFEKSELFDQNVENIDKFQTLSKSIKSCCNINNEKSLISRTLNSILFLWLHLVHLLLQKCIKIFNFIEPLIKYSSVGIHLNGWLNRLYLIVDTSQRIGKLNLKTWNLLMAIPVDILCGIMLVYYTSQLHDTTNSMLQMVDAVVSNLRELLQWLMGSPAGLKLNNSFNVLLGRFFLYHITLWWTFLMVGAPLIQIFMFLRWLGPLGLTFVTAVLADFIALGTFHVYCIYVYASRFYRFQIMGLSALWRLFLGRKFNPLRNRVDSCQYSHRQLFVGTLAFTILLFLLPTTTLYYAVFATLRLCLVAVDTVLCKLRTTLQNFPLFVTYLWITNAPLVAGRITLEMDYSVKSNKQIITLYATLKCQSWKETIKNCKIDQEEDVQKTGNVVQKIISGHLL